MKLTTEVRHAQKRYFACRTGENLTKAKNLERQVDKEIEKIINPLLYAQQKMF